MGSLLGPLMLNTFMCSIEEKQPHSQVLSSLPPLVTERKTLVVAGHVTTQNLSGKKSVGQEGLQSVLIVAVVNLVGFKTLSSH